MPTSKSTLPFKLRKGGASKPKGRLREPVWKGPEEDGVTYSLLCRFLVCRERFRLRVIEGYATEDRFDHLIEYGNMWHVCEETLAAKEQFEEPLKAHCNRLLRRYPLDQEKIDHWYRVCKTQFPIYVAYWKRQKDVLQRMPIFQEKVFDVAYVLPSGRIVRLRGKWDAVDLIGRGEDRGIYIQEDKTKSRVWEPGMNREMNFDFQTMIYAVALSRSLEEVQPKESKVASLLKRYAGKLKGMRYNVIIRPLSGGKGSIKRHSPSKKLPEGETKAHYYERLGKIIQEDEEHFFKRWKVDFITGDLERFRRECLDPILEQLCDWWESVTCYAGDVSRGPKLELRAVDDPFTGNKNHWRHPFGVYNVLNEGGASELDELLATGSEIGLSRDTELFRELR